MYQTYDRQNGPKPETLTQQWAASAVVRSVSQRASALTGQSVVYPISLESQAYIAELFC